MVTIKKQNMRTIFSMFAICLLGLIACNEEELGPLVVQDGKPNILSNISVENLNGGARISYTLPDDPDLLYVTATYPLSSGVQRTVKSSVFGNSLTLEGFSTTDEREVTLHTVNRSENLSDPMKVKIKPLISPLEVTFNALEVMGDFGGVTLRIRNETGNEFVFYTLTKEETGTWEIYDRLYSSAMEREHSVRGLEAEPQEFGFVLQDKWQNRSDTLFTTLTPLYEEELDKSLWRHHLLDNDNYYPNYPDRPLSNLWSESNANFMMATYPGIELPNWFTVDLGQTAVLGRMKMNSINSSVSNYQWFFSAGSPRIFEIWGSNDPALDGSWDNWTLLDRFESIKPSGTPIDVRTAEDISVGLAGEDFKFSNYDNAYRYIRFRLINTWGNLPTIQLQELTFWGEPKN